MVWPLTKQEEPGSTGDVSMATSNSWKTIPPTPGAASWALKALPTIFFGTPKPQKQQQNDQVFADITNNLETARRMPSTPGAGGPPTKRKVTLEAEGADETEEEKAAGILKTPGTAGRPKNVSFAQFSDHLGQDTEEEFDVSMSPSVRQKSTKLDRIRSGLPANFPGKFPSPFTPKVIREYHEKADQQELETEDDDNPTVESIISLIMENSEKLEQLTGNAQQTGLSEKEKQGYQALMDELRQQNDYAMDYAKLRDQEVVKFRAQLAELTEQHTQLMKDYEEKKDTPDNDNGNGNDNETEEVKNEVRELREVNNEMEKELRQLRIHNSENGKLRKTIEELRTRLNQLEKEDLSSSTRKQNLEEENSRLRDSEESYKREIELYKQENEQLKVQRQTTQQDLSQHTQALARKLSTKESELANLRVDYEYKERQVGTLQQELAEKERSVQLLKEKSPQRASFGKERGLFKSSPASSNGSNHSAVKDTYHHTFPAHNQFKFDEPIGPSAFDDLSMSEGVQQFDALVPEKPSQSQPQVQPQAQPQRYDTVSRHEAMSPIIYEDVSMKEPPSMSFTNLNLSQDRSQSAKERLQNDSGRYERSMARLQARRQSANSSRASTNSISLPH